MTRLVLSGESLALKNCRINPTFQIKEQDMSGQASSTSSSEQGDKGQELTVTALIPFTNGDLLGRIYHLARAKDEHGKRTVYVIGCDIAKALKIRQVRFAGRVQATEQEGPLAWKITFRLREHLSVSEQTELRKADSTAVPTQTQNEQLNQQIEATLNQ